MPRRLIALFVLLFVLLVPRAQAFAEDSLPASTQRYRIEAELDAVRHRVTGKLTLRFTNTSTAALEALLFHLYLNAFRDANSVFMRESHGNLRGVRANGNGSIALESLAVDGEELLPSAERTLLPEDQTQLSVPLKRALAAGAHAEVQIRFVAQLPKLFARSGYTGEFFAVAQWFPKLAKLEADGRFAGFPYHALGEFYADFADYDVTLRVPANFQVGAVGTQVSETRAKNTRLLRYRANHVHDMAWFAAPDYVVTERKLAGTAVSFLAPPGYALAQLEHERVVERGLEYYGRRYGPYPYPKLTVVIPPRGAEGAAGMEYPSLIVSAGHWLPAPFAPSISGAIVTAHELAHQWFYGVLASNEVAYPVLDEGLTQWASLDLMRSLYGENDRIARALGVDRFEIDRIGVLSYFPSLSPGRRAPEYTQLTYATSVYGRAALALESIRRAHGKARFEQALARYARDQRFGHPTPKDLSAAFDAVYGAGFAERVLNPLLFAGEVCAVRLLEARTRSAGSHQRTEVRAVREGKVALPTWLVAYDLEGREVRRIAWPSQAETLNASFDTDAPIARVALDPDRALLLDGNTRDQIWVFRRAPSASLLPRLIALAQQLVFRVGP